MRLYIIVITFFFSEFCHAQDMKQQINSIKQNDVYMNAEATDKIREEAFKLALEELISEANAIFSAVIPFEEAEKIAKYYEIKRHESVRVFIYALVSDLSRIAMLYPIKEQTDVMKPQDTNNSQDSYHSDQLSTTIPQVLPSVSEQESLKDNPQLTAVSEIFSRMNTFSEVKSLLREYKPVGRIKNYNWVTSTSVPQDAHIVIFCDEKIVGVLSSEVNGKRINILNSQEDSIINYSKCRAIWYK